jgi:hypothetical protein
MVVSKVGPSLPPSCSNSAVCWRRGASTDFPCACIAIRSPDVLLDTTSFCGLALADAAWAAEWEAGLIGRGRFKSSCLTGWVAAPFFTKDLLPAAVAAAAAPVAVLRGFVGGLRLVGCAAKAREAP